MCQETFDSFFDVVEELVSSTSECECALVVAVTHSGHSHETPAAGFVEDNSPLRRHLGRSLSLDDGHSRTVVDLDMVESLSLNNIECK